MELECGYSPQDQTIAILSFSAPLNQHWPRPRPLLENQPWEEHCSETLLRSSPILQTPADYKLLHIHAYIKICIHLPTPDPSPSLWTASLTSGSVTSAGIGCRTGWLLAGAGLPPLLQVVCLWCIMCFCCWGVFPVLTLYSSRSIVWGLFFFSSPFLMYALIFIQKSHTSLLIILCMIVYVTNKLYLERQFWSHTLNMSMNKWRNTKNHY